MKNYDMKSKKIINRRKIFDEGLLFDFENNFYLIFLSDIMISMLNVFFFQIKLLRLFKKKINIFVLIFRSIHNFIYFCQIFFV